MLFTASLAAGGTDEAPGVCVSQVVAFIGQWCALGAFASFAIIFELYRCRPVSIWPAGLLALSDSASRVRESE